VPCPITRRTCLSARRHRHVGTRCTFETLGCRLL
jgi:hypothetical protein